MLGLKLLTKKGTLLVGKTTGPVNREVKLGSLQCLKGVKGRVGKERDCSGFGNSGLGLFDVKLIVGDC